MLKPADPAPPGSDRPIGDLAGQLVDDAKAFARAEVDVAKAIAGEKANAVKTPLILFAVATFVAMAALNALAVGVVIALDGVMPTILAAVLGFLLFGAIAGAMAWVGYSKLRKSL